MENFIARIIGELTVFFLFFPIYLIAVYGFGVNINIFIYVISYCSINFLGDVFLVKKTKHEL